GDILWAKALGGLKDDRSTGIAMDADDNVYITGTFQRDATFGATTLHATSLAQVDGFMAKLDPSGNFLWVRQFDGPVYIRPRALGVDSAGNAYAAGDFAASPPGAGADFDFLAHPGAHILNSVNDHANAFVVKLDRNGNFQWVRQTSDPEGVN